VKRVLVFGASGTLGSAIVEYLAENNYRLAISARNESRLRDLANRVRERFGVEPVIVPGDMTDPDSVNRVVTVAANALGGLDGLVYIQGAPKPGGFMDLDIRDWEDGVRLLVLSAVWVTKFAISRMGDGGSIVYVASSTIRKPVPELALSSVLRHVIVGLVKTLALELSQRGIRVNAVLPGYFESPRMSALIEYFAKLRRTDVDDMRKMVVSEIPMKRLGNTRELAAVVEFLLSNRSSYVTGQILAVDGGLAPIC